MWPKLSAAVADGVGRLRRSRQRFNSGGRPAQGKGVEAEPTDPMGDMGGVARQGVTCDLECLEREVARILTIDRLAS